MDDEAVRKVKAELAEETKRYRRHAAALKASGEAVMTLALDLLRANVPPSEVERLSPFTDSYIRKAAREAGLPPVRPARGVTAPKRATD